MNKAILIGRLTEEPRTNPENTVVSFNLAVDRRFKNKEGKTETDFISIKAFGKSAEFVLKWLKKGMKIAITGRIQTGSYTNKEGNKVYTTDVIAEEIEFAESKKTEEPPTVGNDFITVPDDFADGLPFK